jgi:hypothetical protein
MTLWNVSRTTKRDRGEAGTPRSGRREPVLPLDVPAGAPIPGGSDAPVVVQIEDLLEESGTPTNAWDTDDKLPEALAMS